MARPVRFNIHPKEANLNDTVAIADMPEGHQGEALHRSAEGTPDRAPVKRVLSASPPLAGFGPESTAAPRPGAGPRGSCRGLKATAKRAHDGALKVLHGVCRFIAARLQDVVLELRQQTPRSVVELPINRHTHGRTTPGEPQCKAPRPRSGRRGSPAPAGL